MRSLNLITLFLALTACVLTSCSKTNRENILETPEVRAELLPAENNSFNLQLHMGEGWHIYSKDPQEYGRPTEVSVRTPVAGYQVRWPEPEEFFQTEDIKAKGYRNLVALQLFPAPELRSSPPVEIDVVVSWVACKKVCVPGNGVLRWKQ